MKKLILIFIALLFSVPCFARTVQDAHKDIIARRNVAAGGEWSTVWLVTNECTGALGNLQDTKQIRNLVSSAISTGSGSKIRLTFQSRSDAVHFIVGCVYMGPRSGTDVMTSTTEITFNSGGHGFDLAGSSATITSDEITFAFSTGQDYLVQIETDGDNISSARWAVDGDAGCLAYYDGTTPTPCSNTLDLASDGTRAWVQGLKQIEAYN